VSSAAEPTRAETARLWDISNMRIIPMIAVALGLAVAVPAGAWAAGWGGIDPGVTTMTEVRERYGAPSKETKQKVEGYDTTTWVYEGSNAPVGMVRMTIDLGLLKPDGFKPELVRVFVLEPKSHMFPLQAVMDGWGMPTAAGDQGGGSQAVTRNVSFDQLTRRGGRGLQTATSY